jgi:hypothetical protein
MTFLREAPVTGGDVFILARAPISKALKVR